MRSYKKRMFVKEYEIKNERRIKKN